MKQDVVFPLSIIVPVYNVEAYVAKCLSSLERQTYTDFEVLMIDDGSTDSSGMICKEWEKKDIRFHYFYQNNQGLGPARNFGIKLCKSNRIMFVDSDDWVDITIVEKLLQKSVVTDADIVYCDWCVVYPDGREVVEPIRSLFQLINASSKERINYSVQRSLWCAIYKKNIWEDNDLYMPNIIYEDTAVYGLLLCFVKKITTVSEALYFYRTQRNGSLMQIGKKDYKNMLRALECFLEEAKRRGLNNEYSRNFFQYCKRQLGIEWKNCQKHLSEADLICAKFNMECMLSKYFPNWKNEIISGFMALGSYTSCDVYNRVVLFRDYQKENYAFTTLESLMSEELEEECYSFNNNNLYRTEMVKKDFKKTWRMHLNNCQYIILDLLEERHDILRYKKCYFTKSEAYDDTCQFYEKCQIIPRKSEECRQIWRESCNAFFDMMEQQEKYVFVLELYLCEKKGIREKEKFFDDIEEIRGINEELRYYYDYIKKHYCNAFMISMRQEVFFSSLNYPFGCYPWHYNEAELFLLSEQIKEFIK